MARYVLEADTTIDGIIFRKGTIMNIPSTQTDVRALGAYVDPATGAAATTSPLYTVPRLRFTDTTTGAGFVNLALTPPYLTVQQTYTSDGFVNQPMNEIGRQPSTGLLPPNSAGPDLANVIVEPVLPVANSQYD
jgi:hypothetical protein